MQLDFGFVHQNGGCAFFFNWAILSPSETFSALKILFFLSSICHNPHNDIQTDKERDKERERWWVILSPDESCFKQSYFGFRVLFARQTVQGAFNTIFVPYSAEGSLFSPNYFPATIWALVSPRDPFEPLGDHKTQKMSKKKTLCPQKQYFSFRDKVKQKKKRKSIMKTKTLPHLVLLYWGKEK